MNDNWQMEYYFGKKFKTEMLLRPASKKKKIENENRDGGLERVVVEKPKGQNIQNVCSNLPVRCRQAKPPFRGDRMKNPEYFRLIKDGHFIGFKRIITEYLPVGQTSWQLGRVEHDKEQTQRLSKPAMGIETLKRERITSNSQQGSA